MCSPAYRACHLLRCGRCPPLHDGAPHSAHDLDLLPHDHDLNRSASSATYARTTSTSPDSAHRRACGVEVERAAPRWQAPSSSTPSLRLENQRKPESPKLRARLYEGKHSTPTKKKCCNCRNSKCLKLFRVASHRRLPSPPRSRSRLQTYYLLMLDDMEAVVCLISLWSTTAIRTHNLQREYQIKYLLSLSFFIKSFLGGFKCTIPWFGERREDEGAGTSQSILEARQTHPLLLLKVKMHKMI
uniref:Uncharacterized protein n=1 Tax=Zea mays TaxID=4577 RepID=A0A804PKN4_MAIZE